VYATDKIVRAANGTQIDLLGETEVTLKLGALNLETRTLVSDHVLEGLLGIDWLSSQGAIWNFIEGCIYIQGTPYHLESRQNDPRCCRVMMQQETTIEPRTESIVSA
jgi:hypothetical protein